MHTHGGVGAMIRWEGGAEVEGVKVHTVMVDVGHIHFCICTVVLHVPPYGLVLYFLYNNYNSRLLLINQ
jgi:hypothetical protein